MVVVDSCVISASGLVYFIFDCRYLEVTVDCFVGTYQGAFNRDLSIFDWKRWSISMLELLAVPHSWIP